METQLEIMQNEEFSGYTAYIHSGIHTQIAVTLYALQTKGKK